MTLVTALRKINTLSKEELQHCIQRVNQDIVYYKTVVINYPPDRMEKYAKPYITRLEGWRKEFEEKLNESE